jgi:hypothetical protein
MRRATRRVAEKHVARTAFARHFPRKPRKDKDRRCAAGDSEQDKRTKLNGKDIRAPDPERIS